MMMLLLLLMNFSLLLSHIYCCYCCLVCFFPHLIAAKDVCNMFVLICVRLLFAPLLLLLLIIVIVLPPPCPPTTTTTTTITITASPSSSSSCARTCQCYSYLTSFYLFIYFYLYCVYSSSLGISCLASIYFCVFVRLLLLFPSLSMVRVLLTASTLCYSFTYSLWRPKTVHNDMYIHKKTTTTTTTASIH